MTKYKCLKKLNIENITTDNILINSQLTVQSLNGLALINLNGIVTIVGQLVSNGIIYNNQKIISTSGTKTSPSLTFNNNSNLNNGIYAYGSTGIGIASAGIDALKIGLNSPYPTLTEVGITGILGVACGLRYETRLFGSTPNTLTEFDILSNALFLDFNNVNSTLNIPPSSANIVYCTIRICKVQAGTCTINCTGIQSILNGVAGITVVNGVSVTIPQNSIVTITYFSGVTICSF